MNTSYKNKSIMIVDDSEFSKRTMAKILKDNGFNVKAEAGSAEEAISILKNNHCDLFIIDIVMPETSGLELAKIIKDSTSDPKIIMISSLTEETIIMDAINSGAQDFIQKPFAPQTLITSITKLLSHTHEKLL